MQNLKLAFLFFENLTIDIKISYFGEKKIIKPNCCLSTYKSQCFKEFYEFILGHGLDRSGLNQMGVKKDMRNDNLFFKRVTDIIILDYPLSIVMKNVQRSKRQALTSFSAGEK